MANQRPGNQTANTPDLSETELREMKIDDLRERARDEGVQGASSLRKEELVDAISRLHREHGEHRNGKGKGNGSGNGSGSRSASGREEAQLHDMKLDDLRDRARDEGVKGASSLRKDELVEALLESRGGTATGARDRRDPADDPAGAPGDAGPDGGRVRTGPDTSKSLKYSQEVTSPGDEPERAGRSLVTTSHEVIRQWAESRGGAPATVEGTEHGDRLGVLRFDFGDRTAKLRPVTWEEWFATFDDRKLNFIYQEERSDGRQSTFFRLESPDREDA